MTNSEWAAWVQAVGSVVAIGIAIAVPYYQTKIAREDQQEEREKKASALFLALWPEIEPLRHFITTTRGWMRWQKVTNSAELNNFLIRASLPEMPNVLTRIQDGIYFDKATCSAYHRLVAAVRDYERSVAYYKTANSGGHIPGFSLSPSSIPQVPQDLVESLSYMELILDESFKTFQTMWLASRPNTDRLLKRPELSA